MPDDTEGPDGTVRDTSFVRGPEPSASGDFTDTARARSGRDGNSPDPGSGLPHSSLSFLLSGRRMTGTAERMRSRLSKRLNQTETMPTGSTGRREEREAAVEPVELAYPKPPQQEQEGTRGNMDSDYVRSLPDWAQRFLKEHPSTANPMGNAAKAQALPQFQQGEQQQVSWKAPNYRPPESLALREKGSQEKKEAPKQESVRISEAEIRRTADRVYAMIEDRIRLERRRLGL